MKEFEGRKAGDGTYDEIKTEFVSELVGSSCLKLIFDLKATGGQNDGEGDPEAAVGRECSGTEGVADGHFPVKGSLSVHSISCRAVFSIERWRSGGHSKETQRVPDGAKNSTGRPDCLSPHSFWKERCSYSPHACQKLHQPTIPKSDPDDQIGRAQPTCTHVNQTQYEGRQGESAQTQRCRIGNSAVLNLLVQTGLEFTSKGREAIAI